MRYIDVGYKTNLIPSSLKYSSVIHICILLSWSLSLTAAVLVSYKHDTNIYIVAEKTKGVDLIKERGDGKV